MNLEVEVGRRPDRVACRDEADDVPGLLRPVEGERRVGGEVRVVELVSGAVAGEPVAADRVQADEDSSPATAARRA